MPFDEHKGGDDGRPEHNNGGEHQAQLGYELLMATALFATTSGYCAPCFTRGVIKTMIARFVGIRVAECMKQLDMTMEEAIIHLLLDINEDVAHVAKLVHKQQEKGDE